MSDAYHWWRLCLEGKKMPIHDSDPQCGYFKLRDRSGENKHLAAVKRPWIPAAIWIDEQGNYQAEIKGVLIPVNDIADQWIWIAKYPISYEEYTKLHEGLNQ